MNNDLNQIKKEVYEKCDLEILAYTKENESKEYDASRFELNGHKIISRSAKSTPKKVGQFVTFWKRSINGPIEPFDETDKIDFYVINVRYENCLGQFVFPKSTLIKKGILSTKNKEGKRGFRVYPSWDVVQNKQAERTQKWQLNYFYEVNKNIDFDIVTALYKNTD